MPYRLKLTEVQKAHRNLLYGMLTMRQRQNTTWTPQVLKEDLDQVGLNLTVEEIQAALDLLVTEGIMEQVR